MRTRPPIWLWAVPILTFGLLAPIPLFVIALKIQTKRAWTWFGVSAGASVLGMGLVGSQPEDANNIWTTLGVCVVLANLAGALTYLGVVGNGLAWGRKTPQQADAYAASSGAAAWPPPAPDPNAAAIAGIQAARRKRQEARDIVHRDPQMARDLRIGRPDLPRHYDDGGLVDLNSAPAVVLVRSLGLSEPQASHLVDVRQQLGRFMHPDDLMNVGGLDPRQYDSIRERVVLL